MREFLKTFNQTILPATLNSYSVVFFFNNRFFGTMLLVVSFFNFMAGLSGLLSVLATVLIINMMGFDKSRLSQGIYSFNSLLTGIGMGTFFEPGPAFFVLLLLATLFSLMVSIVLSGWLGKYGLPFLSIPFVISFWLVLLPSGQFSNLGLTQRNIFWMNEMYAIGGKPLLDFFQTIENLPLSEMIVVYLRSLSSIIFQDNLVTGIIIASSLLVCSRISFLLSLTGFTAAWIFARLIGTDMTSFSFYNIGANYILVAIAAGGFFTIPSRYSFLWVVILVPLTSMLILFLSHPGPSLQLPVFSLPFSIIVILFVYFLLLRVKPGRLVLTPYQYYSPEINLYSYKSNTDRTTGLNFFPLHLPFWGEWTVYQGYDGEYTHKGEWGNAVDFVLADEKGNTKVFSSGSCSDYFCYNKPVLAPADGTVAEIIDNIDDNEPGKVNAGQNWGNTVIIGHTTGLYSQMSHLRSGTLRVKKGDFVRKGDIIALCGNSGRSPEPHLHFQVQATSVPGAKTIHYPFSYYFRQTNKGRELRSFSVPAVGERISDVVASPVLSEAFNLQPGTILRFRYSWDERNYKEVKWEVFTDSYNYRYIFCSESRSYAYFINDGTMFWFTSFFGDRKSLLYYFYLTAYKVLLGYYEDIKVTDYYPLHIIAAARPALWLHDFVAPFYQFIKAKYTIGPDWADSPVDPAKLRFSSRLDVSWLSKFRHEGSGMIFVEDRQVSEFSFETKNAKICARRISI